MKKILLSLVFLTTFYFSNGTPLWMRYPSISPDGNTIVFSYQGDLFTVDASGGNARYLTTHVAYDYRPVWSPDSKKIAFASNRYGNFDIFLIDAQGGIPEQLTNFSGSEVPSSFSVKGDKVLYTAIIQDNVNNVQFPTGVLSELYAVDIKTKDIEQVLSTPAVDASYNNTGTKIIYNDSKGYEDKWRKHHQSSVTRDVWLYDTQSGKHKKITNFRGEDREPVFAPSNDNKIYYLTENFGTFNVATLDLNRKNEPVQLTKLKNHPVRFLSVAKDGTLCFTYNGEIYTKEVNRQPQKVNINIQYDLRTNPTNYTRLSNVSEMEVSPNGKEIVFISRGEVFVTRVDYSTTKQITNTPEQERSASFSPDGKSIIYASERNNSWNLYQTKLIREDEKFFSNATILKEEPILITEKETFQPKFSPDGKKVAYLEERVTLKVLDLDTNKSVTVMDGYRNYSYRDGDQYFDWSPDSKWLLVEFSPNSLFTRDIGLVKADGTGEITNLTQSGYNNGNPRWMMDGKMMIFSSDKQGNRSHGSWGAEYDVYAMFFTKEAYDTFKLSKEEYEIYKKEQKEKEKDKKKKDDDKKGKEKDKKKKIKVKPIKIELNNIEDRIERLTINSSALADAVVSKDGEKLYYLSRFEKGADLWMKDLRKNETKLLIKMSSGYGSIHLADDGKKLFVFSGGRIYKVEPEKKSKKPISFSASMNLDQTKEKEYMFNHIWRQVKKKFYVKDLHGVDWKMMKTNYSKFLPHINNNFDYAEMLSEMLGELNGSHTGARYRPNNSGGNSTASLGILWDWNYRGNGIKIAEIIEKGPFDKAESKISPKAIITKINGKTINNLNDYFSALNHQRGKNTLVTFKNTDGTEMEEVAQPISWGAKSNLLYKRWIKNRRAEVEKLSNGKIGYIHVRGMNSYSYRDFYSDLLGKNHEKKAVIVDTRFNGGGWLHDDLATTLSGKEYVRFNIRGKYYGKEPMNKWTKPSVVIMGEGNYSDAHGFPYTYKTLGIGKLVGMPVPGTMTAVWWERLQDGSLVFGIPQVGTQDMNGNYLENQQLEPDVKVQQDYEIVTKGRDQQIEKAVELLLNQIK